MTSLKITHKLKNSNHWSVFYLLAFLFTGVFNPGKPDSSDIKKKETKRRVMHSDWDTFSVALANNTALLQCPNNSQQRLWYHHYLQSSWATWWANLFLSYLNHQRRLHAIHGTHMVILGLSLLEEATLPARNFSPLEVILSISSAPRDLKAFFLSQEVLAGNTDTISISQNITKERWRLAEKHPTSVSEVFLQRTKKGNRL